MQNMAETHAATRTTVDLTSCDREPIHQIGAIQSVGFLVAFSADWVVTRMSANAAEYLGRSIDAMLGTPAREVLCRDAIHAIRNQLSLLHGPDAVERLFAVRLQEKGALFDLAIHKVAQMILIEAEPSQATGGLNAGSMVRSMLSRMRKPTSLLSEATRLMQMLTGFDRVMIYRFQPDGSGEVIAERVRADLEPYLGLRYPAEDIPVQARALLLRNPFRLLADVGAEPSPILCRDGESAEPLDLSMSVLRAHSTMCTEYYRNMGVGATMTVSLVRDAKLWGLIACHHMAPRHVGFDQRTTVELFGQMLSLLIEKAERDELVAYEARTRHIHDHMIASIVERGSVGETIADLADRMTELIPCDGIGVYVDGIMMLRGITTTRDEFAALLKFLDRIVAGQVYATEALGDTYPSAQNFSACASGILVIPVSRSPSDYLVFFRSEITATVTWAGRPGKLLTPGPNGVRLTPRRSFEAWCDTMRGHSAPWTEPQKRAAEALRVTLLDVVLHLTEITEKEGWAAAQKQELLIAELNHRVRNILGLIRGLITQSRTTALDVNTFAMVLGERVHALARAHDQITARNWGPGSLATLISTEAGAYLGARSTRLQADGPDVLLQPQAFSTVALVIHELMTNAAKYGALSNTDGRVAITWSFNVSGNLILDWTEAGGPSVQPPTRRGFGTTIIERSIPHELGGEAALSYGLAGVKAQFSVPACHVVVGDKRRAIEKQPSAAVPAVSVATRLSGTVLLVEDNIIIAYDAEEMLLSLGAARVAIASNVVEALHLIETETPSFALLDVNLGSDLSWPVATRLRELGIRHIFATGYGSGISYPLEHRSTPVIIKPYSAEALTVAAGQTFL